MNLTDEQLEKLKDYVETERRLVMAALFRGGNLVGWFKVDSIRWEHDLISGWKYWYFTYKMGREQLIHPTYKPEHFKFYKEELKNPLV